MFKNISKNVSKNLSCKYGQKLLNHAKQSATDALKTSSTKAEATGDLIGNKIAYKITEVSKTSPQNSLEIDNDIRMIKKNLKKENY